MPVETQLQLEPDSGDSRVQSVTAITSRIKNMIEGAFPAVWVRGELSNVRTQASGHVYFTLKDEGANLQCAIFRNDLRRLTVQLRDGMQVVAEGKLSVFPPHGKYQLIARSIVEDGVGRLQQEFERLKQRLAAEGLFDPERKAEIPAMPGTVGFITSPTGAAVQDFLRILKRRGWRGRVIVLPAKVQGEGSAAEMV
jgi:exodeoxyribonuclease VII large subunit